MNSCKNETEGSLLSPLDFAAKLSSIATKVAQKHAASALFEQISSRYAPSSIPRIITNYRNALKKIGINDTVLATKKMGGVIPNTTYSEIKTNYKKTLWKNHTQIRDLDPDAFLSVTHALLSDLSAPWQKIAIGLCAATGRRTVEVLRTGTIAISAESSHSIVFKGQAKTKNRPGTKAEKAYTIPTLVSTDLVLNAWTVLRKKIPAGDLAAFTNIEVNNKYKTLLINTVSKLFGCQFACKFTMHDLRAAYATICYAMYGRQKHLSPVAYFSTILGHKLLSHDSDAGDLTTPLSYFKFQIPSEWKPQPQKILNNRNKKTAS